MPKDMKLLRVLAFREPCYDHAGKVICRPWVVLGLDHFHCAQGDSLTEAVDCFMHVTISQMIIDMEHPTGPVFGNIQPAPKDLQIRYRRSLRRYGSEKRMLSGRVRFKGCKIFIPRVSFPVKITIEKPTNQEGRT